MGKFLVIILCPVSGSAYFAKFTETDGIPTSTGYGRYAEQDLGGVGMQLNWQEVLLFASCPRAFLPPTSLETAHGHDLHCR